MWMFTARRQKAPVAFDLGAGLDSLCLSAPTATLPNNTHTQIPCIPSASLPRLLSLVSSSLWGTTLSAGLLQPTSALQPVPGPWHSPAGPLLKRLYLSSLLWDFSGLRPEKTSRDLHGLLSTNLPARWGRSFTTHPKHFHSLFLIQVNKYKTQIFFFPLTTAIVNELMV